MPSVSKESMSLLSSFIVDTSILGGAVLLCYGAWRAYAPAGFIVAGLLLLSLGLRGAKR